MSFAFLAQASQKAGFRFIATESVWIVACPEPFGAGRNENRMQVASASKQVRNRNPPTPSVNGKGDRLTLELIPAKPKPGSMDCARVGFLPQGFDQFGQGLRTQVAFAAMADADGSGFGFFGADDEHVGEFFVFGRREFLRGSFSLRLSRCTRML